MLIENRNPMGCDLKVNNIARRQRPVCQIVRQRLSTVIADAQIAFRIHHRHAPIRQTDTLNTLHIQHFNRFLTALLNDQSFAGAVDCNTLVGRVRVGTERLIDPETAQPRSSVTAPGIFEVCITTFIEPNFKMQV